MERLQQKLTLAGRSMHYLKTKEATDWPVRDPLPVRVLSAVLFFVPRANPDYDGRMHLVREWAIEFSAQGEPWREVGLDEHGAPVVSGPDDRNYGFWSDTNFRWGELPGTEITAAEFETLWLRAAAQRTGGVPSSADVLASGWKRRADDRDAAG